MPRPDAGTTAAGGRIAVTGIASYMGARILRRLVQARGAGAVVAVDVAPPPASLAGVRHRALDLTLPVADRKLVEVFQEEQVETVVHAAFYTDPRRDVAYAHELESIGTLHLMAACAAAGVRHVVQRSFTAVYGARGQNPGFLTEDDPPRADERFWWIHDKLEAERHALAFGRRYPRMTVTVLRLAPLLGPGLVTFYTRLFSRRVVSVLLGYDPLLQLLHPDDALAAAEAALDRKAAGVFNIVPRAAVSLLTALHLADKVTVPLPHPVAQVAADLLWSSGLSDAPGGFIDYVRFPFVADGEKARRELGFQARHDSRDALFAYLGYRYPQSFAGALAQVGEARS
jgi:UDP-glucose 4-epimerase